MTPLSRPVRRKVLTTRRPLIVSIVPNRPDALIEIRESGRRKGFSVAIPALYIMLAQREADRLVLEKQLARRARRKKGQ